MDRVRLGPIANVRGGDGKAALGTSEKKLYPKESALIDPVAAGGGGGTAGAGIRHAHGRQGHHRAEGRHPHPARLRSVRLTPAA